MLPDLSRTDLRTLIMIESNLSHQGSIDAGTPLHRDTAARLEHVRAEIRRRDAARFPAEHRYDVRASCLELDGNGGDGAYDLIMDSATADEIADALRDVLRKGFGLANAGACRLQINIGPAGRGDDLPL